MVGDEITVTVLGVKGGQIRLGINAPKNVPVHREEVYERIRSQWPQGTDSGAIEHAELLLTLPPYGTARSNG